MIEAISMESFIKIDDIINNNDITDNIKTEILNLIDPYIVKVSGIINFFEIYEQILQEIKQINAEFIPKIGNFWRKKELNDTCFGQITSIETQIQAGEHKKLLDKVKILSKLYRNKNEKCFVSNEMDEDLENKHLKDFSQEITVEEFYKSYNYFLNERNDFFFNQWAGIIYKTPIEKEDNDYDEELKPTQEEQFLEANFWYTLTRSLAKDDFTRMPEIEKINTMTVLYELHYTKIMSKFEKQKESNYGKS